VEKLKELGDGEFLDLVACVGVAMAHPSVGAGATAFNLSVKDGRAAGQVGLD